MRTKSGSLCGYTTSLIALVLVATIALNPWARTTTAQDDDPITVVASFIVIADIVEQVGGDHVDVSSLVPIGGDAHTFDPSPNQIAALEEADLIVEAGGDFEPWLDDLVETAGSGAPRYEAFGEAIDHEPHDDTDGDHVDEDNHEDSEHEHADDLHAWLDVHNTIHSVTHLAELLAEVDPGNADAYIANAETYTAELEELDSYIVEQTGTLPEDRRQLITTHQSLGAFAAAYGYEIAGVLLESHSTEGADAPAGHVSELVEIIEERKIPAVFPDSPSGADMLQPVADEAGIEVAPQLYVETLGDDGSGAETYVDMMRHNIDTIVSALGH